METVEAIEVKTAEEEGMDLRDEEGADPQEVVTLHGVSYHEDTEESR